MTQLHIILCDPGDHSREYELEFQLRDDELVTRWREQLEIAMERYPIDDPERFYGLDSKEREAVKALSQINLCIDKINTEVKLIDRRMTSIDDIDTLNYLHHMFELHHGLLDQQQGDIWQSLTPIGRKALADLNIAVHRVETVHYGNRPRFVVTYFGLPKTQLLKPEDFQYMTNDYEFGGLYLNYVEIGKTISDLVRDDDEYIAPGAFQPWQKFSADFTVKLFDADLGQASLHREECYDYFIKHKQFFADVGYHTFGRNLMPGAIQIGQLIYYKMQEVLDAIAEHQRIKSIYLA